MRAIRQFRTFNRPIQLLLLNQLAIMTGFSMLMPYLTGYLTTTLGFAAWVAGLVLGLRTFSQQGMSVIGGTLADRVGYKPVIAGGCVLRMAGFLLFAFSDALPSVLMAALLTGLGGALFAPAVRAYLASESGERRVEAFALFQICEGMGACLGPVLGVVLFQISFQLVCVMASVIFLVLTILQIFYLPPREVPGTSAPRPVRSEWKEVLANRTFVVFAVGMVAYLTLYSQLYLGLPLEVRRLTGDEAGTGVLFTICALFSIMMQVHITAYLKAHYRPLQAIAVGLMLMGGAFLPLLAARPFLPIHALPGAFGDTTTPHAVLMEVVNFSPAFASAMLLSLGTMVVSPFALSLIPGLGGNRLLGTYFGFYYLVQGSGTVVGNLAIGAAFDTGATLGFPSLPWLLLVGFGLASAVSILSLDRKGVKALASGVPRFATVTAARS
jgi:MFS family permease